MSQIESNNRTRDSWEELLAKEVRQRQPVRRMVLWYKQKELQEQRTTGMDFKSGSLLNTADLTKQSERSVGRQQVLP